MIRHHYIDTDRPLLGGYFTINGERAKSCEKVLDLFEKGMPACEESTKILTNWLREYEEDAKRNERQWVEFSEDNPMVATYGI